MWRVIVFFVISLWITMSFGGVLFLFVTWMTGNVELAFSIAGVTGLIGGFSSAWAIARLP